MHGGPEEIRRNRLEEMGIPGFGKNPPAAPNEPFWSNPIMNDEGIPLDEVGPEAGFGMWHNRHETGACVRTVNESKASYRRWIYGLVGALLVSVGANYYQWARDQQRAESDRAIGGFIDRTLQKNSQLEKKNRELEFDLSIERDTRRRMESLELYGQHSLPKDPHLVPDHSNDGRRRGNGAFSLTD